MWLRLVRRVGVSVGAVKSVGMRRLMADRARFRTGIVSTAVAIAAAGTHGPVLERSSSVEPVC